MSPTLEPLYLDASALAKLTWPEAETAALRDLVRGATRVIVTDLAVTEVVSMLGRRQREGVLSAREAARLAEDVQGDLPAVLSLTPDMQVTARRLLLTSTVALRTLDALHLAAALTVGAQLLVTFDRHLRAAAQAHGVAVYPT